MEYSKHKNNKFFTSSTGDKLAKQTNIKVCINKIRSLTALPEQHFSIFYLKPLYAFLAITQHCNDANICEHLHIVVSALKLRRSFILPAGAKSENNKDLWTYAVFVAALMCNLPLLINKAVLCTDNLANKDAIYKWCLFDGAIPEGHYYKVVDNIHISHYASLILLPSLFNSSCITWLYRDINAFNCVIESIASPNPATPIGEILCKVYNIKIPGKAIKKSVEVSKNKVKAKPRVDDIEPIKEPTADDFHTWLLKMIDEKDDLLKTCSCETLDGMAYRIPDIFQIYTKSNHGNWASIQKEFLSLNYHTGSKQIAFPSIGKRNVIILKKQLK